MADGVLLGSILLHISILAYCQKEGTAGEAVSAVTEAPWWEDPGADSVCLHLNRENFTCAACIQLHERCAWCRQNEYDEAYERCAHIGYLRAHGCPESEIDNPETKLNFDLNEPLTNAYDESGRSVVQMTPQKITVNLRPKSQVRFTIKYRQAVDYPVDLYYLMDLSYSMKDDKTKLAELGGLLAERMRKITKNFRLGFGSFIDKKLMPFVDPRLERMQNPCPEQCAPPYGFKNQMSLTQDTARFSKEVEAAEISGNLDAPEGGFDAVVQALACSEDIGWRQRARKMIVFSTDAGFHYAGDGRLAGVVMPNDGQCHLDEDGYYTKSSEEDYPSVAMLQQKIKERNANLIFAVTENHKDLYSQLSDALPGVSSSVGILANDSRNIVELIEAEYHKISQKITMVDNANSTQGLRLSYRSMCLNSDRLKETNVCDGIKVGDEVAFDVILEATHCVDKRDFVLKIGPSGLDEKLEIGVHVQGDCECEKKDVVKDAEKCHNIGDLKCGVCDCHGSIIGRYCQCSPTNQSSVALDAQCRKDNSVYLCSGHGTCECGICRCDKGLEAGFTYSGKYCECDNFNCPHHNRLLCGGHGSCNCRKCECDPGFTGIACHCPVSTDTCMAPNGKLCSGHGTCICGQCRCSTDGPNRYSGPKCELCTTCQYKCDAHKPCVMCQQWKTGPYNVTQCEQCPFKVIAVDTLPDLNDTEHCQFVDPADDCTFYFRFLEDVATKNVTVWVKRKKDCPGPVPVLAIVLGVTAGIVLLGLLALLVWKVLAVMHDRAEFAKFEKDRLMPHWDTNENPLYKGATTTFKNPAYEASASKSKKL